MIKSKIQEILNHQGFMKYFFNTSWVFAEKVLRIFVSLFVGIWVARYLGPDRYGLYSYVQSFVGLFTAFATLGLDGIVVRELIKNPEKQNELIGTAFWLKLLGAFVVLSIMAIAVNFTSNDNYTNILTFIIASATIFQSFNVVDMYFKSKVLSKYVTYANVISLSLSSIVKIILVFYHAPLMAFAAVVLFDSIILALGFLYFYIKNNVSFNIKQLVFNKLTAVHLLRDSWPLILSGIAISLYMKIDQVIIKEMLDNKSVGQYAAAVRFSNVWLFITVGITESLFPAIINAKKISYSFYIDRIKNLYRLLVLISLGISILIYISSKYLILYTFGESYQGAIVILQIYVWSIIFVFLNNGSWKWYISENLQHIAIIRLFLGAAINIVLNLYWIKIYGLEGAAYATLVSYAVATYFGNLLSSKTIINFKMQTQAIFTFYKLKGLK